MTNISNMGFTKHGIILMYHRVAEVDCDPWSLAVSPKNFAEQLENLKRIAIPVRLSDLFESNKTNEPASPFVILTFDDGYADNYHHAARILKQYEIPATFFLVSGHIISKHGYWWDELTEILLTPGSFISLKEFQTNLKILYTECLAAGSYTDAEYQQYLNWRWEDPDPTPRHTLFRKVYWWLRMLPEKERQKDLKRLRLSVDHSSSKYSDNRILSRKEVRELASQELFEIGSHSIYHQDLITLSPKAQLKEMSGSKRSLERITGKSIHSFCYPYGSYNQDTVRLIKQAGYSCACSVQEAITRYDQNPYELPRVQVNNWNADEFTSTMSKFYNGLHSH